MDLLASLRPCPQCGTGCEPGHQYCAGCGFPIGAMAMDNGDKLVGQTLPGGYQILDLLSVGGMGRVYRAEQRALGRTVAVKVIHPHLLADENSIMRFMTEARAASQLNHPNSVSVIDFGKTEDGQPYLVMEFLRGKDLARVAYEQGPLPFDRIANVLIQVLHALSEAHDLEIIHRDLKPENIILEPLRRGGDFVKVVDFGLAKLRADASTPNVTMPGIVCGTPDYMAPEQGRGDPIDGRSDLYGLGVVLYQLVTGRLPFESENPTQVVMMHLSSPVPDPRELVPERNIPDPLLEVMSKSLEKNAADRYQDAEEFADALQDAIDQINGAKRSMRSLRPSGAMECPACKQSVPVARFCCDCGQRLPVRTERHTSRVDEPLPPLPLPFVGREEDLLWLEQQRSLVRERPAAVRIVSEAGMGKTRLVHEFLRGCRSQGDVVVHALPDPYWAEVSFHTLRQVISGLIGEQPKPGSRRQWRDAHDDEQRGLTLVFGGGASHGSREMRSIQASREDILAALRWALERAATRARGRRLVIAIEDIERVDTASRLALEEILVRGACDRPVLLLATHGRGFEPGWGVSAPARSLHGFSAALVHELMGEAAPLSRLIPDLDIRPGVAPLYLEQVIRFSMEGGSEPPQGLADLIAHRLGTLPPAARQLLQALAVLGERAELSAVQGVMGTQEDLQEPLRVVKGKAMVEVDEGCLSISHPLLREIVLLATPAGVRRDLHRRAIRLFDKQGAPLEVRALHCYHASESMEALLLLEQVAERALARGDEDAAVRALRRGLQLAREELSRGELDDPLRAMVIFGRKLGDALTQAGQFSDAEGVLREALDIVGPAGTDRAQLLASLATVAKHRERPSEAADFMEQAIVAARGAGAEELAQSLTARRARVG